MENTTPNTNNFLNWVEIKNFKSIKDLRLDCKRVNVFIGKPNVGKSNILEGLGLLGGNYDDDDKFMAGAVRYKQLNQLFYDNDPANGIYITTDKFETQLITSYESTSSRINYSYLQSGPHTTTLSGMDIGGPNQLINLQNDGATFQFTSLIEFLKKYDFTNETEFNVLFSDYLLPPNGLNLYSVVRRNNDLWGEFAKLFAEQSLELVLSDEKQEFILQKKKTPFIVQYSFFSIADTFRRFMFYITAIESNKNSVIIFEEPEVHSFPPYTQEMAYRMIYDESNQYFISTHSPYMLHPFIEKMDYKDLNIFITYYKDYQTHVRALTEEELIDILDYSTNVFFNLRKFEPNA